MNLLLTILGTLRLSRLVTTDWIGFWWFRQPATTWALKAERDAMVRAGAKRDPYKRDPMPPLSEMELSDDPRTWQGKLVKGLDCPFCVGFWAGVVVLASMIVVTRLVPPLLPLWRFVMGTLALNYVVGHVGAKLD
jgi:hypothetical protein